jgi:hypothetical protein
MCELSIEQLEKHVSSWIEIYHRNLHDGLKDVPINVWNKSLKRMPVAMLDSNDINKFSSTVVQRIISNGRVRYKNLFWYSHALLTVEIQIKEKGKESLVDLYIDEQDLSSIHVRNPFNNTLIKADTTTPDYISDVANMSMYEHNLIQGQLSENMKSMEVQAYVEVAKTLRRQLWKDVEKNTTLNKRKKRRVTAGNKNKAMAERATLIAPIPAPIPDSHSYVEQDLPNDVIEVESPDSGDIELTQTEDL